MQLLFTAYRVIKPTFTTAVTSTQAISTSISYMGIKLSPSFFFPGGFSQISISGFLMFSDLQGIYAYSYAPVMTSRLPNTVRYETWG